MFFGIIIFTFYNAFRMDKVIFENLKLKEHIQQLKTRTEGESALLLEARRERDILAKQVKSLEEEVSHLTSQLAAKDAQATKSAKHFTELDEELKVNPIA